MKAEELTPGLHYTFQPITRDRERLPVINASCQGRDIDYPHDILATIRIFPGDLVKLVEIRSDKHTVLLSYPRATGLCITDVNSLQPAEQPNSSIE